MDHCYLDNASEERNNSIERNEVVEDNSYL